MENLVKYVLSLENINKETAFAALAIGGAYHLVESLIDKGFTLNIDFKNKLFNLSVSSK